MSCLIICLGICEEYGHNSFFYTSFPILTIAAKQALNHSVRVKVTLLRETLKETYHLVPWSVILELVHVR